MIDALLFSSPKSEVIHCGREVTIDSIQIEIESNSTNASKGLDALAGSLEKFKKNGYLDRTNKNTALI